MNKGVLLKSVAALFIFIAASTGLNAQFSIQHQAPTGIVPGEATPLEFIVPGISRNDVDDAVFFWRVSGDISYTQQEVLIQDGAFSTNLQVNNTNATSVEYYLVIRLRTGEEVTFPENSPRTNPVEVQLQGAGEEEKDIKSLTEVDFNILSPQPGFAVVPQDVVVAIALFYNPDNLQPGEFKLFVDGRDVTSESDTSAYFFSYAPETLPQGNHRVALDYLTDQGERLRVTSWSFSVVDPGSASFAGFGERNVPVGEIQLSARNQDISGDANDAFTGRLRLSGQQGKLRYSINGFLTSQESSRLQPQNRFGAELQLGKWWEFQAGHIYPVLSRLSINGRRILGINTEFHLLNEGINLQFMYGELNRKVTNQYGQLVREEVTLDSSPDPIDTTYTLTFENRGRGTFRREVIGGRVAFGNERKFQFGIHALKIEDDSTSIDIVDDFNDLNRFRPGLTSSLSSQDIQKLSNSPQLLQVEGSNPNPKGNFVAGSDLKFNMDNNRIQFEAEASAGILNDDITQGPLDIERAEELGLDIDEDTEDLLDRLSFLIIINENLTNLPIRIEDDSDTEIFFPTAILASNNQLGLNYLNNNLRIQYRWIGPDYNSLANSTVRKDISGVTITDRFRLFQNRVYVTLGYENLSDNVVNTKNATTETQTYRSNVSWFPVSRQLPRVSAGIRFRDRDNGVSRFNPNLSSSLQNQAVQNFAIVNGDTVTTAIPRQSTTLTFNGSITQQFQLFNIVHDASLNLTTLNTTDDVFDFGDTKSTAVSIGINSRFINVPLNTSLGFSVNNSETISGLSEVDIVGIYAGANYRLLDGKLRINGRIAGTNNETTSRSLIIDDNETEGSADDIFVSSNEVNTRDFDTFVIRLGAQYNITQNHALLFDSNFTNVSGINTSNDRIVELRYIFNF